MSQFTHAQLAQKENADTSKVLSISFEYLLAGIANEHSKLYNYSSLKDFNEFNRLGWSELISYPFFVALANGNSKSLYSLFGEFYASSFGPISGSIFNLMERENLGNAERPFKFFTNPRGLGIKNLQVLDLEKYDSFYEIQKEVKYEILNLDANQNEGFKDIMIVSDTTILKPYGSTTSLFAAIDSGIKIIQQQSGNTFFDGDMRTIKHQATYFESLSGDFSNSSILPIVNYEDVGKPELRPFYKEEMVN